MATSLKAWPKPGTVIQGYRYQGGDPNLKTAWVPASWPTAGQIVDHYRYDGGDPNQRSSWSDTLPKASDWDVTVNDANKGISGLLDAFGNVPTEVWNLASMPVGVAATALGHPDLAPKMLPDPNVARKALKKIGAIRHYRETSGQKAVAPWIEGATAALSTGGDSLGELLAQGAIGALSGGAQAKTAEMTGDPALAATAGLVAPEIAMRGALGAATLPDYLVPHRMAARVLLKDVPDRVGVVEALGKSPALQGSPDTMGARSRSPELANLEAYYRELPDARSRFHRQLAQAALARKAALQGVAPETDLEGETRQMHRKILDHLIKRRNAWDSAEQQARTRLAEWSPETMKLGIPVSGEQFGTVVQDRLARLHEEAKQQIETETAPLRDSILSGQAPVDLTPVIQSVDRLMAESKGHQIPEKALTQVKGALLRFSNPSEDPAQWTPEELQNVLKTNQMPEKAQTDVLHAWNLRKSLNDVLEGATDDPSLARADSQLIRVRSALDEQMNAATQGAWGRYLETYRTAVRKLDPFTRIRGKIPLALKTDEFGHTYAYEPEEVARMAFTGGPQGTAAARHFKELLGADPEVTGATKGYIAHSLRDALIKQGDNTRTLNRWVAEHEGPLREYALYSQVKEGADARNFLEDHLNETLQAKSEGLKRLATRESALDKSVLGRMVKGDPDKIFASLMNGRDPVNNLKSLVAMVHGNTEALNGLRATARDYVFERHVAGFDTNENPRESLAKQLNTWKKMQPVFEKSGLWTKGQMNTMEQVARDLERTHYAFSEGRSGGVSPTFRFGSMTRYLQHRLIYSMLIGVGGADYLMRGDVPLLMAGLGGAAFYGRLENQANQIVIKAALDPDYAHELLKPYTRSRALMWQPFIEESARRAALAAVTGGQNQ